MVHGIAQKHSSIQWGLLLEVVSSADVWLRQLHLDLSTEIAGGQHLQLLQDLNLALGLRRTLSIVTPAVNEILRVKRRMGRRHTKAQNWLHSDIHTYPTLQPILEIFNFLRTVLPRSKAHVLIYGKATFRTKLPHHLCLFTSTCACNRYISWISFFFLEFLQVSSLCIIGISKKCLALKNQRSIFAQLQAHVLKIEGVLVFG